MTQARGPRFDLEERTFEFARRVRRFVKGLPRTVSKLEDVKQLVRASGSVGANYIEANEALGQKDFRMHLRICKKETKELRYFLRLLDTGEEKTLDAERDELIQETKELTNIFSAILKKSD